MLAALLLELLSVGRRHVCSGQIARLRPYAAPRLSPDEVIYYSGDELPHTEDLGGAAIRRQGRAGGKEVHHRTQTIHVARGTSLAAKWWTLPISNFPLPPAR